MKSFVGHGHVMVTHDLWPEPKEGVVRRILHRGNSDEAWVEILGGLEDNLRAFPADDEHGRGNHLCVFAFQCQPYAGGIPD